MAAAESGRLTPPHHWRDNAEFLQIWLRPGGRLEQHDVERIAHATMKELGVFGAVLTISQGAQPGHWRIDIRGGHGPDHLKIRCGQGSSPQWVRDQIFEQFLANG
jgi:hypothetical protein